MSQDAELRIYVCGRLAVESATDYVLETGFPARQGRRLWAYMVLNRQRPVGRQELAASVWTEHEPDAWDEALSALASRLRSVLRPVSASQPGLSLLGEPGRYMLRMPTNVFVDYERALKAIHVTETLMRRDLHGPALAEARVAREIASRGFLAGEEGQWVEVQRRRLADIHMRALEHTVQAELGRGRPEVAEQEAREMILLDPLRESGYRLLMRALADGGNSGQASSVLEECRKTLWDQAAAFPSDKTVRLYKQLVGRNPDGL